MYPMKLAPAYKDYLWGGHELERLYGKAGDGDCTAESWELSCHPDGKCTVRNGAFKGKTLEEVLDQFPEYVSHRFQPKDKFPILIKFIDAKENLSIQVHPSDDSAKRELGEEGKAEMWYVLAAKPHAFLYYGLNREVSREELEQKMRDGSIQEILNKVEVNEGDCFFIHPGTIHAIGKGLIIAEIQQNSNVTYRVYDYGRVGKDGKKRELHIEKAVAVTNCAPAKKDDSHYPHIADCDYFTVDKLNLDGTTFNKLQGNVSEKSF